MRRAARGEGGGDEAVDKVVGTGQVLVGLHTRRQRRDDVFTHRSDPVGAELQRVEEPLANRLVALAQRLWAALLVGRRRAAEQLVLGHEHRPAVGVVGAEEGAREGLAQHVATASAVEEDGNAANVERLDRRSTVHAVAARHQAEGRARIELVEGHRFVAARRAPVRGHTKRRPVAPARQLLRLRHAHVVRLVRACRVDALAKAGRHAVRLAVGGDQRGPPAGVQTDGGGAASSCADVGQ